MRAVRWVLAHLPELGLLALAIVLRVSMHFSFEPLWGYDAYQHWEEVEWIAAHSAIPAPPVVFTGYHPPLWYAMAAGLVKLGGTVVAAQWMSILFGVLKVMLVWVGVELYFKDRAARLGAIALATILPVMIHMDGMLTNEVGSNLFAVGVVVLVPKAFSVEGRKRWWLAAAIGVVVSLQLLTKISALTAIAVIGGAVFLELVLPQPRAWRERIKRALPFTLVVLIPIVLTGWYFGRNVRDYGKPFISSFDSHPEHKSMLTPFEGRPFLDRRPKGFLIGWDTKIFEWPYVATALNDDAQYPTAVTAATFVDFWNFRFAGIGPKVRALYSVNGTPLTPQTLRASRRSMWGGAAITFSILVAWVVCLVIAFRRRLFGELALLMLPALTLCLGAHFAIAYPLDYMGVIKSSYLQYGMSPLFGVFGLAYAWTLKRRITWPLFVLLTLSLWVVAAYSIYCRTRFELLPL